MKENSKSSLCSGRILTLTLILSFHFLILCGSVWVLYVYKNGKGVVGEEEEKVIADYKLLHYDSVRDEVSVGFVSLPKLLEEDQCEFYDVGDSEYHLISNFGSSEYICSGKCYCSEEDQRRSASSSTYSKGVTFLTIAASSIIAHQLAKEYFSEECDEKLYDECSETSLIHSEVDKCEEKGTKLPSNTKGFFPTEPFDIDVDGTSFQDRGSVIRTTRLYYCKGFCRRNINLDRTQCRRNSLKYGCEKMMVEGEIKIREHKILAQDSDEKLDFLCMNWAKTKFIKGRLDKFCKKHSRVVYSKGVPQITTTTPSRERDGLSFSNIARYFGSLIKKQKGKRSFCVGTQKGIIENPTVKCVLHDKWSKEWLIDQYAHLDRD